MPWISTLRPEAAHLDQIYNGMDAMLTLEIFQAIEGLPAPPVYNYERALQGPILEMMLRGFRIDPFERDAQARRLRREIAIIQAHLNAMAYAIWDKPLNPNSPLQLKDFFYGTMRFPEIWSKKKGERKLSTDREALEQLDQYFLARPLVACILGLRERSKQLSVFETEIDPDGRWRTSYNIGGTETGRLSSSASAFGTGCVLPETECLTLSGWKKIASIQENELIAQYDNGEISFVPAKINVQDFSGYMRKVKGEQIQLTMTPTHRVLYYTWRNPQKKVFLAKDAATKAQLYIPIAGQIAHGIDQVPAFAAMLMADFSKEGTVWRGAFKKERKIQRFLQLAKEHDLKFDEIAAPAGYRRFSVKDQMQIEKKWGAWILNLTTESAKALVEEARYWDSHDRGSGFQFWTADKEQAEWFATLVHFADKSASIRQVEQTEASWSITTMWCVNVKERNFAQVMEKHWSFVPYTGKVYCPTVPSSFWLVRENGYISVTGNSNSQNIAPALKRMFVADQGFILYAIDLEQAESREVGWLCGILFGDWSYLDACESGDLHTLTAKLIWPQLGWTGDAKQDRKIADHVFYREFSYRDMSKRGGHGSNYLGTPFTMARHLKVPTKLMEDFQESYFTAFPAIPQWHQWVAAELQTKQSLTTPFGFERTFFGRQNDATTLREAVAFSPQSSTAHRTNLSLLYMWEKLPRDVQLLAQVHDAIVFQAPESYDPKELAQEALTIISEVKSEHNGRTFSVPGECKIGWNWGYYNGKTNPDGLMKIGVQRTRTPNHLRIL